MVTADMKSRSAAVLPNSSTSSWNDKTEWLEENVFAMLARPSLSFESKDDEEPNVVTRFSQPALPVKADGGGGGGEPEKLGDLGPGAVDGLLSDLFSFCILDFLVTVELETRLDIDEEGFDKGREVVERDLGTGKGELGSESLPMECLVVFVVAMVISVSSLGGGGGRGRRGGGGKG